jgi:hypothetical protein
MNGRPEIKRIWEVSSPLFTYRRQELTFPRASNGPSNSRIIPIHQRRLYVEDVSRTQELEEDTESH